MSSSSSANSGTGEGVAIIGVDLQKCFKPGGNLATVNARNTSNPTGLEDNFVSLVTTTPHQYLILTKDQHPEGHVSFYGHANIAGIKNTNAGRKTIGNAISSGNNTKGSRTAYKEENILDNRKWGDRTKRTQQKIWPPHCVKGSGEDNIIDTIATVATTDPEKSKLYYVHKGHGIPDSYSAIADATGRFTPYVFKNEEAQVEVPGADIAAQTAATLNGPANSFLKMLQESNINTVYLTGIARDVCVFWTAMDMLNFWTIPAFNHENTIKIIFMYDLTRPVVAGLEVYGADISPTRIERDVKALITAMLPESDVNTTYNKLFEIRRTEDYKNMYNGVAPPPPASSSAASSGGRRRSKRHTKKHRSQKRRKTSSKRR